MNSDIRIHCIQSEFMNLISLLCICNMNSLLKIEFNYELNIYEFTDPYFMGFMVSYKKHSPAAQYNQPKHL